jgi:hypothetical protein
VLTLTGIAPAAASSSAARAHVSSQRLLQQLPTAGEHAAGYERSAFRLWVDADGDGCDTREEVLIAEAVRHPTVGSSCRLTGGRWRSRYDAVITTHPSGFDIDHLVPLNEAWQSGAYRWTATTRTAYANDLGYAGTLIAVTARTNRSKSDRDPREWMPPRASYSCRYVADWVAVKWRWHLSVDAVERRYLARELRSCGWPPVPMPSRPRIRTSSSAGVATGGAGSGSSTGAPAATVGYAVHPGAFCAEHGSYGHTSAGTLMRCTTTPADDRYRWRAA